MSAYVPRSRLLLRLPLAGAPLGAVAAVLLSSPASAATLTVGPGQTYTTPCAAVAAASPNDEIDIMAGTYTDTCTISTAGLHLKGIGGQPKIDVTGETPAGQKGVYAIEADNVIIENLELTGAQIPVSAGENAAGLRIQANGVVVTNCYIHDNQDGILSGPVTGANTGTQTIEHTQFENNGLGNGCTDGNGCTHNVYVGDYAHLIFQFNYSHSVGTDGGHLVKSRALETDLLYNRLTGEMGNDSYEVDLPQGGLVIAVGNEIEKGPNSDNTGTSFLYGDPGDGGFGPGPNMLYLANNTFVNDSSGSPTFVNVGTGGGMLAVAHDNLFSGMGTPSSTGALSMDNLSGVNPLFVAPATYDYHLQAGSPAIGKGVPEGSAGAFSLVPVFEYVDPLSSVARTAATDVGAFEYGTNVSNPSTDAGAESPDAAMTGLDAEVDSSAPPQGDDEPTGVDSSTPAEGDGGAGGPDSSVSSRDGAAPPSDGGSQGTQDAGASSDGGKPATSSAKKSGCSCAFAGRAPAGDEGAAAALAALGALLGLVVVRARRHVGGR